MAIIYSYPVGTPKIDGSFLLGTENTDKGQITKTYTMNDIVDLVVSEIPPVVTPSLYSGTFFDTTTQASAGATSANQVLINSTQQASGFSLGPDNRINILNSGVYLINLLLQLAFTGGATYYNVTVWYTVNDVIAPNSAFTFTTTSAQNDQTLANVTDTVALTAGQYLKFYWWSPATGMRIISTAAGTNPTRPFAPSVNLNIFNVG